MKMIIMMTFPSVLALAAAPALAQTQAASTTPAAVPATQGEVTPYPPSFFTSYSPSTANDMVSRVPGFQVDGGDDGRGLAGAVGNVLIDGERPPGKTDIRDVLSRLPASQVARIDLIRGGAPGIDMQGKPVVVNIIRVEERGGFSGAVEVGTQYAVGIERNDGSLDLTGTRELANGARLEGEFSYNKASGEPRFPGGSRVRVGPSGNLISSATDSSDGADEDFRRIAGALGSEFDIFGGKLSLSGQMSRQEDAENGVEAFANSASRFTTDSGEETESAFDARFSQDLPGGARLESIFTKSWSDNTSTSTSSQGNDVESEVGEDESGETALRTVLNFDLTDRLKLETGADAAYNFLEGARTITENGVVQPLSGSNADVNEKRAEVFVVSTWRMRPELSIEGGLRYEFSTITASGKSERLQFVKPSLQAFWQIGPQRQFQARIERTVDQLDFGDFLASADFGNGTVLGGAVELTPTQYWTASAQYDQQFWGSGSLQVRLEHSWLTDIIGNGPDATGPGEVTRNIGDGRQASLNAEIELPLDRLGVPGGRIGLNGEVRLVSEMTDPFTGETRPFPRDSEYGYGFSFEQDINSWNISYGFDFGIEGEDVSFRRNSREVSSTDPEVNAFLVYRPTRRDTLRLQVRDLIDSERTSQRTVYSGLQGASPVNFIETRRNGSVQNISLTYRRAIE